VLIIGYLLARPITIIVDDDNLVSLMLSHYHHHHHHHHQPLGVIALGSGVTKARHGGIYMYVPLVEKKKMLSQLGVKSINQLRDSGGLHFVRFCMFVSPPSQNPGYATGTWVSTAHCATNRR